MNVKKFDNLTAVIRLMPSSFRLVGWLWLKSKIGHDEKPSGYLLGNGLRQAFWLC
ncbi:MAG: hypothetical protein LBT59_26305 [Clostridiales bacterium]|nr:hypothetical protein [Clostridiales bacterium]